MTTCTYATNGSNTIQLDCPTSLTGAPPPMDWLPTLIHAGLWIALAVVVIVAFFKMFFTVQQQGVGIVERFSKFNRLANPGLHFKWPFIESMAYQVSLKVEQHSIKADTKTKDDVFVEISIAVQYRVLPDHVADSYYLLYDEEDQINAYVLDIVRSSVPKMDLDDLFSQKDTLALAVKEHLDEDMRGYGFEIITALVVDIAPDEHVRDAMNEIQAQARRQVAAKSQGEANKILRVKEAEADAESKRLQGEGTAAQRKAIIEGLHASMEEFKESGVSAKEVLQIIMMTQYFDTLREMGHASKSNTIFLPHSPGGVADVSAQIRDGMLAANATK